MSFNWQKDEEQWEENTLADNSVNTTGSRRLLRWGGMIILLIFAGWFVYYQINKQMETAVSQTESQLLSSHQIIIRAAGNQDEELLRMQLSGQDDSWANAQLLLGKEKLFFDRPQFNLSWQPADDPIAADIQIDFNPQLNSAEVTYPLTYLPDGGETAVVLQGTAVYRHGAQRWLMASPKAAFWGEERKTQTANITLTYPERDEDIAVRLAGSLQNALDKMCQLPDFGCPSDLELSIRLSTHPDSLLNMADRNTTLTSDVELPTPTLVGLPVDEAGYAVVANGYATQMVTAVISDLVAHECCQHQLFHRALMDWQLNELGLQTWPMTTDSYVQLTLGGVNLPLWRTLWTQETETTEDWQAAYALIEYLQTQIAEPVSVAELQREINRDPTFIKWLRAANNPTIPDISTADFGKIWDAFVWERVSDGQETAVSPIPYPAKPLEISCWFNDDHVSILTYDPAKDQWQDKFTQEIETRKFGSIQPILNTNELYLATERKEEDAQESRFSLVENGQVAASFTLPFETPDLLNYSYRDSSPDARYMLLGGYTIDFRSADYRLLDVRACLSGDCQTQPAPGQLRWSLDGKKTLFTIVGEYPAISSSSTPPQPPPLFLGDEKGEHAVEVGQAVSYFWLDENTYSYIRYEDDGEMVLATAVVGENRPRVVQSITELRQQIHADVRPDVLSTAGAYALNNNSRFVIVNAVAPAGSIAHSLTFLLTLNEDFTAVTTTEVLHTNLSAYDYTSVTPDGRWQLRYEYGLSSPNLTTTLIERGNNSSDSPPFTFPSRGTVAWSGDWFASVSENVLLLAAPAYNYRQYIPHDLSGCYTAYWPSP